MKESTEAELWNIIDALKRIAQREENVFPEINAAINSIKSLF